MLYVSPIAFALYGALLILIGLYLGDKMPKAQTKTKIFIRRRWR